MTSILMVCLGNICRSPLAHGIFESKVSSEEYFVDSAGTAAYHVGNNPDKRSIKVALDAGLDISTQRARQFQVDDFDNFDYIFAMDQSNFENIIRLARNNSDKKKVKLFLDANPNIEDKNVPDPYYGGESGFEYVFKLIDQTCDILKSKV